MAGEATSLLKLHPDGLYVDATFGGGGHSLAILEGEPTARLIAIDRDSEAIERGAEILAPYKDRAKLLRGNFREIADLLAKEGVKGQGVDGIVADIGLSSFQLDTDERGFSFRKAAKLDMRMDQTQELSAYDLVNELTAVELEKIFSQYGEERYSRRIARRIVSRRADGPIETTTALREVILEAIPPNYKKESIDPATRVFQALRIKVNDELESLSEFLDGAVQALTPNGRLVIITFHSLEDRIVKRKFRELSKECVCPPRIPKCVCDHVKLTKEIKRKALTATEEEVARNPRARSAKLRAVERV
jgi:16S rRNA (cytosine1402-N4)-methyltransferase